MYAKLIKTSERKIDGIDKNEPNFFIHSIYFQFIENIAQLFYINRIYC